MEEYNYIREYIKLYFKKNFNNVTMNENKDGFNININSDIVYIKRDEILGWHCFGNVADEVSAKKIEKDLETYLNYINCYYCNIETGLELDIRDILEKIQKIS